LEEDSRTRLREEAPGLGERRLRRSSERLRLPVPSFMSLLLSFTAGHDGTDLDCATASTLPSLADVSGLAAGVVAVVGTGVGVAAGAGAGVADDWDVVAVVVVEGVAEAVVAGAVEVATGLTAAVVAVVSVELVAAASAVASRRRFNKSFLRPSVGRPCFFNAARSSATFISVSCFPIFDYAGTTSSFCSGVVNQGKKRILV